MKTCTRNSTALGTVLALIAGMQAALAEYSFDIDVDALNAAGPPAGTVIDAANVGEYNAIVDENLAQLVAQGMLAITVQPVFSITPHPAFLAATTEHGGKAQLGDAPGVLNGYVAGLPFPEEPRADDPRAGDKIAWNVRYAWGADSGEIPHFYWQYRDMRKDKVERELTFYAAQLRYMHRHVQAPVPVLDGNPEGIYSALYLRVIAPGDLANTQLLVHRPEDDTARDATWLYPSTTRRVRILASGQTTDAFLGSDIMIEDFVGYNGRLMDMRWKYIETRTALLPFFDRDKAALVEKGPHKAFKFVDFHGAGHCFPNVPWQLRKVYVLEATPVWNQHPLSKRRYYVDAQSWILAYGNLYDRPGKLWKIGYGAFAHPDQHAPENHGMGFPIVDAAVQIDIQAQHCTTLQFHAVSNAQGLTPMDFNVQALRGKGR
jgi:hypothetical protein